MAIHNLRTTDGLPFGLLTEKPTAPAPTVFVFGMDASRTLMDEDLNQVGRILSGYGVVVASLSLPCHGDARREFEPAGLDGWRARLEQGDNPMEDFTQRASAVLDYLVAEHYTDPARVAACGISRGGFSALHWACVEPRLRWITAISPVTNLMALREFAGMEHHLTTQALNLEKHAESLVNRSVFVVIGNADVRVDTDSVVAFARQVAKSAPSEQIVDIELHVEPSEGHRTPEGGHDDAAVWLISKMNLG